MSILVIDVGTSGVRAAVVRPDATVAVEARIEVLPDSPAPGLVEFDAAAMADAALDVARRVLAEGGPVEAVGIANQRASVVVWDRATGEPVAPALGWQDLRTVGDCLTLQADGLRLAPNQSATKIAHLLDAADPDRTRDLCAGTVDAWITWHLTGGTTHVTDLTNAAVTGLLDGPATGWDAAVLDRLRIPAGTLPRLVDSSGPIAEASALPGAPPICGLAGDQQASLIGQGCVAPGPAKITFGTGGMLDLVTGPERPVAAARSEGGTFPIVTWRRGDELVWGLEAIMLSAGTNVEWLRDDMGLIPTVAESHDVAQGCTDTEGVVYVPALLGLGTPHWDYGARGTLLGVTRGTGRAHVVRAVLEGVAHRGADLVEAAAADAGQDIDALRVDGGMSDNPTFVQALADATGRRVEVSPVTEATTLGAAYLAGLAIGTWGGWDDVAATWSPRVVVDPASEPDRDRWQRAVARAREWYPELSGLDF
ncbi:FGGY family carbohydrate kinase [Rhabdothermincola salaria]|uniref:FGGY family carbohydrate kinase n=1 Tax=Rhabdothermincola salaria TaxID=2903142 RepID=UPI001E48D0BE|nr:FGGY-family carbohydrate kinase [Rhabdothermincola salaria]MCD9622419.1 glycerol kinase [Rhabdothermincola salaria]